MSRKKMVVCSECKGRGRVYSDETTVGQLSKDGLAITGSVESHKCPKCGGIGKIAVRERKHDNA